jgi:hypothetical protein
VSRLKEFRPRNWGWSENGEDRDGEPMDYSTMLWCEDFIKKNRWQFAKTMPKSPHEYTLQKWVGEDIQKFAEFIQAFGYEYVWQRNGDIDVQLNINGRHYWAVYDENGDCIIVNRTTNRILYLSEYDHIAKQYDTWCVEDTAQIRDILRQYDKTQGVLEIGCGTGFLTQELEIPANNYVGLDPSEQMLFEFLEKSQNKGKHVVNARYEEYAEDRKFGLIIATLGAASYVNPKYWHWMQEQLTGDGKFFLVFFANKHTEIHKLMSKPPMMYNTSDFPLDCIWKDTGKYMIAMGSKQ